MSICAVCVQSSPDAGNLCPYHVSAEDGWAVANRIMCDFVHRAIVPQRLAPEDREAVAVEEAA
jgi:hypothetical protein